MNRYTNSHAAGAMRIFGAAAIFLLILTGCVQQTPIPNYARSGDTVVLGLGGIMRNAQGNQNLKTSDLQITLTDAANNQFTLTASTIFKAFPDYASFLNANVINGNYPFKYFDGGWFVAVPLSYPFDGSANGGKPLLLAPGAATIHVSSSKLTDTQQSYEGSLANLPLEIVAGQGGTNSNYAQQFSGYIPGEKVDISPNNLNNVTSVAGFQLVINYPQQSYYSATILPVIVPYNHNPFIQIAQNIVDNGNGTKTLTLLVSAQKGFVQAANQTAYTPLLSDLSMQLMYFTASGSSVTQQQILNDFAVDTAHSYYIDTSGNTIAGLQPVLSFK